MLKLYVDGSHDDRVIIASGLLATSDVWDSLCIAWNANLARDPVFPYWHASSAWAATKEPFRVPREVREQRETALAEVIRSQRNDLTAFNVWMRTDVYATHMKGQIQLPDPLPTGITATRGQRRDVAHAIDWFYLPLLVRLSDIVLQRVRDARLDDRIQLVIEAERDSDEDRHIASAAQTAINEHMTISGGPFSEVTVSAGKSAAARPLEMVDQYAWCKRRLLGGHKNPPVIALGEHISEMTQELNEASIRAWVESSNKVIATELGHS